MPILCKKHQEQAGYKVKGDADQASDPLQVFTWVRIHRTFTGEDVPAPAVEDAIQLREERHCSVGNDGQVECRTAHDVQDYAGGETGLDVASRC